ncbi:uncharacterized protein LOC117343421 [Pecten maximus]|uniref:uncharacterized protein LOC117343421 n=1 Tax=Pecten maximus TaxID=6579 RepID=UPI00145847D1|nr:uncharacterized protein LOC117343421 [Pecten maximus]
MGKRENNEDTRGQPKRAKWSCPQCDKTFTHRNTLNRHLGEHGDKRWKCNVCNKEFVRKDLLTRHKKYHGQPIYTCCGKPFYRTDKYREHVKSHNIIETCAGNQVEITKPMERNTTDASEGAVIPTAGKDKSTDEEDCSEALGGAFKVITLSVEEIVKFDPMSLLKQKYDDIKRKLDRAVVEGGVKWYLSIQVQFSKPKGEKVERVTPHFRGKCQISLKSEDLDGAMKESIKKIYSSFIEYQMQGSNWTLDKVLKIQIHLARYKPLKASSYIPLPNKLRTKHAIINVQNKDKKCFLWSVLAALHPTKNHPERVSKYKQFETELDFTGISSPVSMVDIPKFETQNQISINVLGYEKGLFPVHVTKNRYEKHVDLLMISDQKKSHYCWIKNVDRLLSDQHTCKNRYFHCIYCLQGFTKQRILNDHMHYCREHGTQKVDLPKEEDKWLFYKDFRRQMKVPYIIYADFETFQVPISGCSKDQCTSYTEKTTQHVPSSFAYKVVGLTKETSKDPVVYREPDVADEFIKRMLKEQDEIEQRFKRAKKLVMRGKDWQSFKRATKCHICKKDLGKERVRDHCHQTGRFRSAAHKDCNINYQYRGRIPVVFHNLREYDSHLIMQAIGKIKNKEIKCIPNNMEKYISFSLGCMDFIDSFQFLQTSLDKLMENLAKEGAEKFEHMSQYFGTDNLDLFLQKQVFPYDYCDGPHRFEESELPPIEAFHSSLSGERITQQAYEHAQRVWERFEIQNLGKYSDMYVISDVLGLADVFENFRNLCLDSYDLDAAHFYTSPGLAWQAALKMTEVKLELLTDIDTHLFIEKGLRGGISMITHRHAEANNSHVPEYDPSKDTKYIVYLDANNLYGWAMSQPLPTHDFGWLNDQEREKFDVTGISDDSQVGYILEVDLEYPSDLHDLHNDYPLAPERIQVTADMLSPYASKLLEDLELKGTSTRKLVPNLNPKTKYILHYRNLKQYLSLGMKLTKVHQVLSFQQSPWLKTYIDFNTERRKKAKNDFEKDFYKLMNNSVFGKTMENLRKREDVKLVNSQKKALKLTCKPSFNAFKIFYEELVAVHMLKQKLYLNKPIYVGFSILDISKTLMYDFHYNYIKLKYGSKATLLFTDTDSLAYVLRTDDLYEDMLQDLHRFDTSEYGQRPSTLQPDERKGTWKDER